MPGKACSSRKYSMASPGEAAPRPCGRDARDPSNRRLVGPPHKFPTVRFWLRLLIRCKLLKSSEAAIGIEPMNKGFAVIANLFAQDCDCIRVCIFIERVDNSCLCVIA